MTGNYSDNSGMLPSTMIDLCIHLYIHAIIMLLNYLPKGSFSKTGPLLLRSTTCIAYKFHIHPSTHKDHESVP